MLCGFLLASFFMPLQIFQYYLEIEPRGFLYPLLPFLGFTQLPFYFTYCLYYLYSSLAKCKGVIHLAVSSSLVLFIRLVSYLVNVHMYKLKTSNCVHIYACYSHGIEHNIQVSEQLWGDRIARRSV